MFLKLFIILFLIIYFAPPDFQLHPVRPVYRGLHPSSPFQPLRAITVHGDDGVAAAEDVRALRRELCLTHTYLFNKYFLNDTCAQDPCDSPVMTGR